jgi:hypothetical protein
MEISVKGENGAQILREINNPTEPPRQEVA